MFSVSQIPDEVVQAYLNTEFKVRTPTPFTLKANRASPDLLALYVDADEKSAAFITACNPHGELLTPTLNAALQLQLQHELDSRKLRSVPGIGLDPSGEWDGEESFLVLGVSLSEAKDIGMRYRQNAIIWAGEDGLPQLVLLR